jgi:hypothetical protein
MNVLAQAGQGGNNIITVSVGGQPSRVSEDLFSYPDSPTVTAIAGCPFTDSTGYGTAGCPTTAEVRRLACLHACEQL